MSVPPAPGIAAQHAAALRFRSAAPMSALERPGRDRRPVRSGVNAGAPGLVGRRWNITCYKG